MSGTVDIAARAEAVRRAVTLLAERGDDGVLAVATALDTWLTRGGDFAAALGSAPGWQVALRLRGQDAALGELKRRHYAALNGRAAARAIVAAGSDYEHNRWPLHRATATRPDGADGLLYDALCVGPFPCEETLRKRIG